MENITWKKKIAIMIFTLIFLCTSLQITGQNVFVRGNEAEEEGSSLTEELSGGEEESSTEENTGEETSEEPTTEEETTEPEYEIIEGIYKVKKGVLIEFLPEADDETVKEITIPAVVSSINPSVFAEYSVLEKVTFEEGSRLKSLGSYTFKNCKSLTSIVLPEGLETIGYKCFGGCSSLEKITIPKTVKSGNSILGKTSKVKTVKFASGTTTISDNFLKDAGTVTTVSVKSGVEYIGKYAFSGCYSLKSISLPSGLTTIGYKAFDGCLTLETLTIPKTVTHANTIINDNTSVSSVVFASGIKKIPEKVLYNATTVTKVVMSDGVETIETRAFYNCSNLSKLSVSGTIKNIQSYAFYGCKKLEQFTTPKTIQKIGKYAFKKCSKLQELVLRKTITEIGSGAFSGDKKLVLKVYANTTGKAYARKNKLNWEFAASEVKRRAKNKEIYKKFMSQVSTADRKKFKLKSLTNYVPQGTAIIEKYLVVSMYQKGLHARSFLLVFDKKTGKLVKKVYLPSVDHVGSLVTVKNRLVVGLNNISTLDYLGIINYKTLKKAKNNKTIKYSYKRYLGAYADFAGFDGKIFWAGHCTTNTSTMYGFKVKVKKKKLYFTKTYSYQVPQNIQGLIVQKGKGNSRTFIFSQSYGRLNNSYLLKYKVNIKKKSGLGIPVSESVIPSMAEGICMDSQKNIYVVFESAAGLYCGNPDFTSEIQIKRICKIKSSALNTLKAS
jgi:hypothetical protein